MIRSNALRLTSLSLLVVAAAAARSERIYGITDAASSRLVSFDSANANGYTLGPTLTGVAAGQTVRAIDFRPANGTLYAIASDAATVGQLYTVNLTTGALTAVGGTFALATTSTRISMDFNPVVDRLRVVSGSGNNLRINPNDGTIAATDTNLADAAGTTPLISDIAYTNNVAGAASTTLYGYNFSSDTIVTVGSVGGTPTSPNSGTLFTVGSSGVVTFDAGMGFDISGATGIGYVTGDANASATSAEELYTVNLATGALTLVAGEIGVGGTGGLNLLDISVAPVPEPGMIAALGLGALALVRRRRKA